VHKVAKVVGPLHSSEARGSVGSLTYNTWRGISIVKARAGPATQYSDDQVALRALTALATASWQSITEAQRNAWRHYANEHTDIDWTGNPQRITGYNWYIRINVRRQLVGEAIEITPPTHSPTEAITGLELIKVLIPWYLTWTDQGVYSPASLYYEVYIAGPHSPGRHPNIQQADRKGYTASFPNLWTWGSPAPGLYTFFARPVHSQGTIGVFARATGTVT